MATSAFADKAHRPTDADLARVLGKAHAAWNALPRLLEAEGLDVAAEWGFTSAKTGWGLRLKRGARVLLYMTPREGHLLVSFALGEKAVAAARAAELPRAVMETIDAAPRYAEGRGVRFTVIAVKELAPLARLAVIKDAS